LSFENPLFAEICVESLHLNRGSRFFGCFQLQKRREIGVLSVGSAAGAKGKGELKGFEIYTFFVS
jgi:hypothetical protein